MGFILVAAICFAILYGMFRAVGLLERKSKEHGLYYSFIPLFSNLAAPILAPVAGVIFLIGLVCLGLAFV